MSNPDENNSGKKKHDVFKILSIVFQFITIIISIIALYYSIASSTSSKNSIEVAQKANEIAQKANEIAQKANLDNNKLIVWANGIENKTAQSVSKKVDDMNRTLHNLNEKISDRKKTTKEINITKEIIFFEHLIESSEYDKIIDLIDKQDITHFENGIKSLIEIDANSLAKSQILDEIDGLLRIIKRNDLCNKAETLSKASNILLSEANVMSMENNIENDKNLTLANHQDTVQQFLKDLKITKHYDDPDLLLWYGIKENDVDCMLQAINSGANVYITDSLLVAKYKNEYAEFYADYNNTENEHSVYFVNNGNKKFNFWDYINNNSIIVITLIAVLLLLFVVFFVLKKKKDIEVVKGPYDEGESNTDKNINNEITYAIPAVNSPYRVLIERLNQIENHKCIFYETNKEKYHLEKEKSELQEYLIIKHLFNQRIIDIEGQDSIIEQKNPSNRVNPKDLSPTLLKPDGSLVENHE